MICLMEGNAAASPGDEYVFGADSPVTDSHPAIQQSPDVSGNIAVWSDNRPGGGMGNPARIFYKDLTGDEPERPLVEFPGHGSVLDGQYDPVINGNLVVWYQGYPAKIHYMLIGAGCPGSGSCDRTLDIPGVTPAHLAVSGHRIVWQDGRNGALQSDIYMFDLDNSSLGAQPLVTKSGDDIQPAIDGEWIVWIHNDDYYLGSPAVNDIFFQNVVTGELRQITDDKGAVMQESPAISGSLVVWDANNGFYNNVESGGVWLYDSITGLRRRIFDDSGNDKGPDIEGNKIVWKHEPNGGGYAIWLHDLASGITQKVSGGTGAYEGNPGISTAGFMVWPDDRAGTRAVYENKPGGTAQQLADMYSPHLYLHHEEYFQPRKVDVIIDGAGTRLKNYLSGEGTTLAQSPDISMETLFRKNNPASDGPGSATLKYVDLPGDVFKAWSMSYFTGWEYYLRTNFVDPYNNLVNTNNYPETTYAHIISDSVTGRTVIQYWLPYYFNNFDNYHEGDWEHVDVMLNGDLQPTAAAYSEHEGGRKRVWDYVEGPDGHPVAYVARGSHSNYFAADDYSAPWGSTDHAEAGSFISPGVEVLPFVSSSGLMSLSGSPYKWLAYQGLWGEFTGFAGGNGPQGPAATPEHNSIWDSPFNWFDNDQNVPWDGASMPLLSGGGDLAGSITSGAEIHLYDAGGRHVGKNAAGGIDEEIPGAEYFEIPAQTRKVIIVHGGDGTKGYRFALTGPVSANVDFMLVSPDRLHNRSDTVTFQSLLMNAAGEAEVSLDQSKDYTLWIDSNSDGAFDEHKQPDSVTTTSMDMTPPQNTADLAITSLTSATASLSFTAPGGDGDAGQAQYYHLRYSTAPITEANWRDAMPVEQDPAPRPAGLRVTATASGLSAGTTYYFALKSEDQARLSSGLSNTATATTSIPSLAWSLRKAYWACLDDYEIHQLSVDFGLRNTGTGTAVDPTIAASICSPTGVIVTTPLPLTVSDLSADTSGTVALKYFVPETIFRFMSFTYSNCQDDAGRMYWFPGQLP